MPLPNPHATQPPRRPQQPRQAPFPPLHDSQPPGRPLQFLQTPLGLHSGQPRPLQTRHHFRPFVVASPTLEMGIVSLAPSARIGPKRGFRTSPAGMTPPFAGLPSILGTRPSTSGRTRQSRSSGRDSSGTTQKRSPGITRRSLDPCSSSSTCEISTLPSSSRTATAVKQGSPSAINGGRGSAWSS